MDKEHEKDLAKAFELKNQGKYSEAIIELKKFIQKHGDHKIAIGLIAALYYSELNSPEEALPYAQMSVQLSPKSEMASLCLVLCLRHFDRQDEIHEEIQRFVKTGKQLDLYITLRGWTVSSSCVKIFGIILTECKKIVINFVKRYNYRCFADTYHKTCSTFYCGGANRPPPFFNLDNLKTIPRQHMFPISIAFLYGLY